MTIEENLEQYLQQMTGLDWLIHSDKDHNKIRFICFSGSFKGYTGWIDQSKESWYSKAKKELTEVARHYEQLV